MLTRDKNHPILMEFDTQQYIWNWITAHIRIFKIQDGGQLPYCKSFFEYNLAADCPISVKICVGK